MVEHCPSWRHLMGAAALIAFALAAPPMAGGEDPGSDAEVVGNAQDVIAVDAIASSDGRVRGDLENRSDRPVSSVRLLVQHKFLWANEFNPGPGSEDPGRSEFVTVSKTIPPGDSVPFEYSPRMPLPQRTDGRFDTEVEVVSYTQPGAAVREIQKKIVVPEPVRE